jgi:hypothetical protein
MLGVTWLMLWRAAIWNLRVCVRVFSNEIAFWKKAPTA